MYLLFTMKYINSSRCCGEVGAQIFRTDGVVITRQRNGKGDEMFINETRAPGNVNKDTWRAAAAAVQECSGEAENPSAD